MISSLSLRRALSFFTSLRGEQRPSNPAHQKSLDCLVETSRADRFTKILLISISSTLIAFILVLCLQFHRFDTRPIIPSERPLNYWFEPGQTFNGLNHDLTVMSYIQYPLLFRLWAMMHGDTSPLQAGEYYFPSGTTATQLLQKMHKGDIVHHQMTFIDGWHFKQALAALLAEPRLKHILLGLPLSVISQKLDLQTQSPEGWLYPNTYEFKVGMSDFDVLQQSTKEMQQQLKILWQQRPKNLSYKTPYQALIVASLLEKEASDTNERRLIAGIILKRLKKRMPLQIDATVIYGLGPRYQGKLNRRLLKWPSLFNTYQHYGLPPTPISLVSRYALYAALHPIQSKYWYYVASKNGKHAFSNTLRAHRLAIKKYHKIKVQ